MNTNFENNQEFYLEESQNIGELVLNKYNNEGLEGLLNLYEYIFEIDICSLLPSRQDKLENNVVRLHRTKFQKEIQDNLEEIGNGIARVIRNEINSIRKDNRISKEESEGIWRCIRRDFENQNSYSDLKEDMRFWIKNYIEMFI